MEESLDGLMEGATEPDQSNIEEQVVAEVLVKDFMKQLTPRDIHILELRKNGYTYQEIADQLGYHTHSAVKKRVDRLAEQWLAYTQGHT